MADRQGIEIDYCPKCRGVWLDKGELDKIIERTAEFTPPASDSNYYQDQKFQSNPYHHTDPRYKHKKKKGFLGDFFDFD
jgi:Zn-finger nucleic acid-binding protein